jgi:hypothetical protein
MEYLAAIEAESAINILGMVVTVPLPQWIVSQIFAFFALIFSFWAWQVKEKMRVLLLVGTFSLLLAASASLLENYTLGVLFGLAGIRNFTFLIIDWRISKGANVPRWVQYFFAGVFIVATVTSTVLLVYVFQVRTYAIWLEWMICATLVGLIIGNIQKGTDLMRVSFIANRVFNIINHVYFANIIAVIIAISAIASNIIYYIRQFITWKKEHNKPQTAE